MGCVGYMNSGWKWDTILNWVVRVDQIVKVTFKQIFEEGKGVWQVEIRGRMLARRGTTYAKKAT